MNSNYLNLKRNSKKINDSDDYSIYKGECNPNIFDEFVRLLFLHHGVPTVFEPFAGKSESHKNFIFSSNYGAKLISYDIDPKDSRIECKDSITCCPDESLHGVFFHPPYWGSSLMSKKKQDISNISDKKEYLKLLNNCIYNFSEKMIDGSFVAAVCRDYRHNGERIRLDHWFLNIFGVYGFSIFDVWSSTPDIVLILRK